MFTRRIAKVYGDPSTVTYINDRMEALVETFRARVPCLPTENWSERDAFLITYGDTLLKEGETPLTTFGAFAKAKRESTRETL
ncbi:MAG: hypothetical protein ACYTGH_11790 [Planctomycetota bacterium]